MRRILVLFLLVLAAAAGLTACAPQKQTVTVRLWDQQVAQAYQRSFAAFERTHPDIDVKVEIVPWAQYWTRMRADLAAGTMSDVFWTNASNLDEYARAGRLLDVGAGVSAKTRASWDPNVVRQYTVDGRLWGVPQLTDPGIGVVYNADLLKKAGISIDDVERLQWDPAAPQDSLRDIARRLTSDTSGRHPGEAGFDPSRVDVYGYSASNDLNAIMLNALASNGAAWQTGDRFTFDSAAGRTAISYLVDLINVDHVAPPAADTNPPAGSDLARDLFLRGKLALFQTGAYSFATIQQGATFPWGVAALPSGPTGRISVTNGIIAAGTAKSAHPDAQRTVLDWLGSTEGARPIGADGSALPAVLSAQDDYLSYWRSHGIDLDPLFVELKSGTAQAPSGAGYARAQLAYQPIFNDIFTGVVSVAEGLRMAETAANAAMAAGRAP